MNLFLANILLALAPPAAPPGTQRNPAGDTMYMFGMFAIMGIMLYFVMFRPEQKRRKQHAEMMKNLHPGDKVVTSGGIVGVIVSVKEKTLSLRSADAKLEINKSAIVEISERGGEAKES